MMKYSHNKIEKKWQNFWNKNKVFETNLDDFSKPNIYILDMFPYPSGQGLHVGHIRGYLSTDIITKIKKMQGFNVFHPMGFDSFGLPTEQYAIRKGQDPYKFTDDNIDNFLFQLKKMGFGYDFGKIIKTSDPKFYKWTQWTFIKMFENNLVEYTNINVNFCPDLNTVLANEEIINKNGKMVSERGEFPVFRVKKKQWVIDITKFGEELLNGLCELDWPESIKKMQTNWIGLVKGYNLDFKIKNNDNKIKIFISDLWKLKKTKFIVISVENEIIDNLLSKQKLEELIILRKIISSKPLVDKEQVKTKIKGINTDLIIINPLNKEEIPIYFSEYIDPDFIGGIKLGVPYFEYQDKVFFKFNNIGEFKKEIKINDEEKIKLNKEIKLILNNLLTKKNYFKLKKWVFSRQRYWGEPFPIIFDKDNKPKIISENLLPLILPKLSNEELKKLSKLEPLSSVSEWVKKGYDTNVMPQWAGSCWYFLAFLMKEKDGYLPLNSIKSKKRFEHWLPVDLYIGGQEHATSHLIYSRFWIHFLKKINILNIGEPFKKLVNQGMILAENGKKMSKSKGNVVDPLEIIETHGADTLRLHEKFLGPLSDHISWNETTIDSMRKWLSRIYVLFTEKTFWVEKSSNKTKIFFLKTIKNVTKNYENLNFNVAISQLMSFVNYCYKSKDIQKDYGESFLKLLSPLAPHLSEELWNLLGHEETIFNSKWPEVDLKDLEQKNVKIIVKINNKLRSVFEIAKNSTEEEVIAIAKLEVFNFILNKKIVRIIFVKNKIINFIVV